MGMGMQSDGGSGSELDQVEHGALAEQRTRSHSLCELEARHTRQGDELRFHAREVWGPA